MLNGRFIEANTTDKVTGRPDDVFFPVDFLNVGVLLPEIGSRLAFQSSHDCSYGILGWNNDDKVQVIFVKANRL